MRLSIAIGDAVSNEINKRFAIKPANRGDRAGKVASRCRVDAPDRIIDAIARRRARSVDRDSIEDRVKEHP